MNILICDDATNDSQALLKIIRKYEYNMDISIFNFADDAISAIKDGYNFDIAFLDIIMPNINGIQLAEKFRSLGFTGYIVFLTSSNDYACESYNVNAFSYLLKPACEKSVFKLIDKIKDNIENKDNTGILVNTKQASQFILFSEILYVDVMSHTVSLYLTNGNKLELYTTLRDFSQKLLCDNRFAYCHRSYIVNIYKIKTIKLNTLILYNDNCLPISKKFNDIKSKYLNGIFERSK